MSRAALRTSMEQGPAVSPFLMLGDPTPDLSVELARTAVAAGARDARDRISVQRSGGRRAGDPGGHRARPRRGNVHPARVPAAGKDCGGLSRHPAQPAGVRQSRAPHRIRAIHGHRAATDAGASTLLVPDIPHRRGDSRCAGRAGARGLGHVELGGPPDPGAASPAARGRLRAFLYLAGFQGVTGSASRPASAASSNGSPRFAEITDVPVCLGFGISSREQIVRAFGAGARIAVVGSHLARVVGTLYGAPADADRLVAGYRSAVLRLTAQE